jgi:hypothetical protein
MIMHRAILGILLCLAFVGCAFNRSDFVTGSDGKPQQDQMSDDGKTVGSVLRGLRPSAVLRF